jgi:hypothetical protein
MVQIIMEEIKNIEIIEKENMKKENILEMMSKRKATVN